MSICVCTRVIVLVYASGKYTLVFRTVYKQEENDKRAMINNFSNI